MRAAALLVACASADPARVLFVGNSFTYGPAEYDSPTVLHNLPRMFAFVARGLGIEVEFAEDTIGACSLYARRPSHSSESCDAGDASTNADGPRCVPVSNARVDKAEGCAIDKGIRNVHDEMHPCPQLLTRQPFGSWDVVVLQDFSTLPTVKVARETMMAPAYAEYARAVHRQGASQRSSEGRGPPVIAGYMTWAYLNGSMHPCPSGERVGERNADGAAPAIGTGCFPLGSLDALAGDEDCGRGAETRREVAERTAWARSTSVHECQAYALARAHAVMRTGSRVNGGADVLVPAGLAWEAARGSWRIPEECREIIDAEYQGAQLQPPTLPDGTLNDGGASILASLGRLPLRASDSKDARWASLQEAKELYRDLGPSFDASKYCDDGCTTDHHASALAMYLNACVFVATLFGVDPVGAPVPNGEVVDGDVLPIIADVAAAHAMQRIARDVALPHLDTWWREASPLTRFAPQRPMRLSVMEPRLAPRRFFAAASALAALGLAALARRSWRHQLAQRPRGAAVPDHAETRFRAVPSC